MSKNVRIERVGDKKFSFAVNRLLVALTAVAKAAQVETPTLPFSEQGEMAFQTTAKLATDLRAMVDQALKNQGSLTVRFLGDLKPTVYPLETEFFHVAKSLDDSGEFIKLLKTTLMAGGREDITFVNLANVRDVKLHVGSGTVRVTDDLSYITIFCDVLEMWANDSAIVQLVETD